VTDEPTDPPPSDLPPPPDGTDPLPFPRVVFYQFSFWLVAWLLMAIWSAFVYYHFSRAYQRTAVAIQPADPPKEGEGPKCGFPLAVDFAQFAAVARAWQTGTIARIYDIDYQAQLVDEVCEKPADLPWPFEPRSLTFGYPPFFLWLPRALVGLPYKTALPVWMAMMATFAVLAAVAWRASLRDQPRLFWMVLLTFLAYPATSTNQILGHAAFVGLAGLSGTLLFLNRGQDFQAGLCLSVLLYKPPLGLLIGPLLICHGRWRAVAGVATGGVALVAAGLAIDPALFPAWRKAVAEIGRLAVTHPNYFDKQYNWLAEVAVLSNRTPADFGWHATGWPVIAYLPVGWLAWVWLAPVIGVVVTLAWAAWIPWRPGSPRLSALLAATVIATLFVTPYLFFYDVMMLLPAGVWSARTLRLRPRWHAWAVLLALSVTAWGVSGGMTIIEWQREHFGFAIQPTPLGVLLWFAVEVIATRTLPASPEEKN
jgi:hypothetical protein